MAQSDEKGAGLSVGATEYSDKALVKCPAAAASAREVADALDAKLVRGVRVLSNPATGDLLFADVQRAVREARGGAFFFYFAGHALRRGSDVLLAVGESELEGTRGCVPLSDVLDILRRAPVARGLVILNVDLPPDARAKGAQFGEGITVIGSSRAYDPKTANVRFKEYADGLIQALRRPALEMEAYLTDGRLDGAGLGRYLAANAPRAVEVQVFASAAEQLALRDLGAQIVTERAAAEKAVAEKAEAEKAAAAAKAAAAEKAAAEKAEAEKAAAAAKAAVAEKAAAEKAAAESAAKDAAELERPAVEETSDSLAAEPAAGVAKKAPSSAITYVLVIGFLVAVIAYFLMNR